MKCAYKLFILLLVVLSICDISFAEDQVIDISNGEISAFQVDMGYAGIGILSKKGNFVIYLPSKESNDTPSSRIVTLFTLRSELQSAAVLRLKLSNEAVEFDKANPSSKYRIVKALFVEYVNQEVHGKK